MHECPNTHTHTHAHTHAHTQAHTHIDTHTSHVKKAIDICVVISKGAANGQGKPVHTIIDLLLSERLELQQSRAYLWIEILS